MMWVSRTRLLSSVQNVLSRLFASLRAASSTCLSDCLGTTFLMEVYIVYISHVIIFYSPKAYIDDVCTWISIKTQAEETTNFLPLHPCMCMCSSCACVHIHACMKHISLIIKWTSKFADLRVNASLCWQLTDSLSSSIALAVDSCLTLVLIIYGLGEHLLE